MGAPKKTERRAQLGLTINPLVKLNSEALAESRRQTMSELVEEALKEMMIRKGIDPFTGSGLPLSKASTSEELPAAAAGHD